MLQEADFSPPCSYQELYGCNNEFYMEEPSSSATLLEITVGVSVRLYC